MKLNLIASARIAKTELFRYFDPWIDHLLEFCDDVVLVCEGGWADDLANDLRNPNVHVYPSELVFYEHEGAARQELLDLTLAHSPSHVLAIDADEFVADGATVRAACHDVATHWSLCMQEVWEAHDTHLDVRQDGGWEEHDVAMLWAVAGVRRPLRIADRALACGRVPESFRAVTAACTGTSVLHFGWANPNERWERALRYVQHDGGRYHDGSHLDSIMWTRPRVRTTPRPWPVGWTNRRLRAVLDHARVTP